MQPTSLSQRLAAIGAGILLIALAGCSSSGGGGSAGGGDGGGTGGDGSSKLLGSRSVPDYQISVTRLSPVVAGQAVELQIDLVGPEAQAVAVWLADSVDYTPADNPVQAQQASTDRWTTAIVVPDPLPAQLGVYVEVTGPDGNIGEAGIDDFRLIP